MAATFHEGEVALQERAGSRAKLAEIGPRVIRDYMPDQLRVFFALLRFCLAGTVVALGQPGASVLAGAPGFMRWLTRLAVVNTSNGPAKSSASTPS